MSHIVTDLETIIGELLSYAVLCITVCGDLKVTYDMAF